MGYRQESLTMFERIADWSQSFISSAGSRWGSQGGFAPAGLWYL